MKSYSISPKLIAEALGTALLLATVVGSGIMAQRLSGDSVGLALLVQHNPDWCNFSGDHYTIRASFRCSFQPRCHRSLLAKEKSFS